MNQRQVTATTQSLASSPTFTTQHTHTHPLHSVTHLGVPDIGQVRRELRRIDEGDAAVAAALDPKGEHGAVHAGAEVPLGERVRGVVLEARVAEWVGGWMDGWVGAKDDDDDDEEEEEEEEEENDKTVAAGGAETQVYICMYIYIHTPLT